ncbi:hypothetical protein HanXRQr2_Chr16g0757411 [Helianthus annuus]|uniref:Uncharacterized protein n=1 Tax=Helianthus annuus TaxID=4232 RepID=A0A9K3GYT2_HELAN|nr:hypothetical protein HanXRQr2_Chr16g0757411 [Helianthus annuus]KAJ0443640.1 hypothetical protein HanIR_Chr16g0822991 [Helianthus annuus]KAJ0821928.1 hypothetical protein HanPSC8_Chr16g0725921 [Helianthus annuus]
MAFSTSDSIVTSQWINVALSRPISSQTDWPKSSWISAMTTLAPCLTNNLAVFSPIP